MTTTMITTTVTAIRSGHDMFCTLLLSPFLDYFLVLQKAPIDASRRAGSSYWVPLNVLIELGQDALH